MRPTADDIIALYAKHDRAWTEHHYALDGEHCAVGIVIFDALDGEVPHDLEDWHIGLAREAYPETSGRFWDGLIDGNDSPVGRGAILIDEFVTTYVSLHIPYLTEHRVEAERRYEEFLDGYGVGQAVRLHFLKGGSDAAPSPARSGAGD